MTDPAEHLPYGYRAFCQGRRVRKESDGCERNPPHWNVQSAGKLDGGLKCPGSGADYVLTFNMVQDNSPCI